MAEVNTRESRVWDITNIDSPKLLVITEETRDLGIINKMKIAVELRDRCGVWSMCNLIPVEGNKVVTEAPKGIYDSLFSPIM
jgi:hypothetical protein